METKSLLSDEPLSIQVDYLYPVHYAKRSWVKTRETLFRGSTTIPIKATSIEYMPVAFRVRQQSQYGQRDKLGNPYESTTPVEIRFHRNRFYAQWSDLDSLVRELKEGSPGKSTPLSGLRTERDRWKVKNKYGYEYETGHEVHDEASLRSMVDGIKTFEDDGGKSTEENALADAEELIVADGKVFISVAEPILQVSHDVSLEPAHGTRHQSAMRFVHSHDHRYLPLSAIDEINARALAEGRVSVEVVRPDLVFADRDDGQTMALAWKLQKSVASHMSEMPLDWAVASARLREAMFSRPRHMTFEIAQAIQDLADLTLPSGEESRRLIAEAGPEDYRRSHGSTAKITLEELPKFKEEAAGLALLAWPLLQEGVLRDRSDTHHVTAQKVEESHKYARARQARSREDVRRVAQLADLPFDVVWDRLRDESLDIVLVEVDYQPVEAGRDGSLKMASIVDRFTGAEVERYAAGANPVRYASGSMPENRPWMEAFLASHIKGLAPGSEPEPDAGRPSP